MVRVFREVRRVLRSDGVCWLNLGDSYNSGSGGYDDKYAGEFVGRADIKEKVIRGGKIDKNLKPKDLVGIPWRVALALQADGWWLRSDVIWAKPNPMPESVTDRPTKAHEYVFLLTKSARYYYDADAIREHSETKPGAMWEERKAAGATSGHVIVGDGTRNGTQRVVHGDGSAGCNLTPQDGRRNKRTVWQIATQSFPLAHFATYPEALVRPCILAGTSEHGCCPKCGAPWTRVVERKETGDTQKMADGWDTGSGGHGTIHRDGREPGETGVPVTVPVTTGWAATCECARGGDSFLPEPRDPIPCTVLDPFSGAGTTGVVSRKLGRDYIGVELNPEYAEMSERRIHKAEGGQREMFV
jgi:DNA modification methylase